MEDIDLRLKKHISAALKHANLGLSDSGLADLRERAVKVLNMCGTDLDFRVAKYMYYYLEELLTNQLQEVFRAELIRSLNESTAHSSTGNRLRLEEDIRVQIKNAVAVANLGLSQNDEVKLQDQMLGIFRDYVEAPLERREHLYEVAEKRVMAIFDPPGYTQGAARSASG